MLFCPLYKAEAENAHCMHGGAFGGSATVTSYPMAGKAANLGRARPAVAPRRSAPWCRRVY